MNTSSSSTIPLEKIAQNLNSISWNILQILATKETSFLKLRTELGLGQEKSAKEIARLEGAYLIYSKRDPSDQRALLYSLTEFGTSILEYNPSKN